MLLFGEIFGQQAQHVVHFQNALDGRGAVVQVTHELLLRLTGNPLVPPQHQ